jgi:hypothetical protein
LGLDLNGFDDDDQPDPGPAIKDEVNNRGFIFFIRDQITNGRGSFSPEIPRQKGIFSISTVRLIFSFEIKYQNTADYISQNTPTSKSADSHFIFDKD